MGTARTEASCLVSSPPAPAVSCDGCSSCLCGLFSSLCVSGSLLCVMGPGEGGNGGGMWGEGKWGLAALSPLHVPSLPLLRWAWRKKKGEKTWTGSVGTPDVTLVNSQASAPFLWLPRSLERAERREPKRRPKPKHGEERERDKGPGVDAAGGSAPPGRVAGGAELRESGQEPACFFFFSPFFIGIFYQQAQKNRDKKKSRRFFSP